MNKKIIESQIKTMMVKETPNVLNDIISKCEVNEQYKSIKNTSTRKLAWIPRLVTVFSVLCLFVGGGFFAYDTMLNNKVDTIVSLDVNPSVQIQMNRKEKVIEVLPLNEDGKIIIGEMDFNGSNLDVTINALIGSMLRYGYISDLANSILISVDNNDATKAENIQKVITEDIEAILSVKDIEGAILSQTLQADVNVESLSKQYNISKGKVQFIQEVVDNNPRYSFDELTSLTINELNLINKDKDNKHVNAKGEASQKSYIGENKAKEIAYHEASVNEKDVKNCYIGLDYEEGVMVYEIDFETNDAEYEYDIDATNGSVVKYEKEERKHITTNPTTPTEPKPTTYIGEEKAKSSALTHAGVKANEVTFMEVTLDTDDAIKVYEVDFETTTAEYDYEVNAIDGTILKSEKENKKTNVTNPTTPTDPKPTTYIGEDKAKLVALSDAGLDASNVKGFVVEFDEKDKVYEVEFETNNYEYGYEISAVDGTIVSSEKDEK